MKKIKAIMLVICMAAVMVFFGGCGNNNEETQAVAASLCLGNRANSLAVNYSSQDIRELVTNVTSSFGYISVVGIDGSPDVWYELSYEVPAQYANANPSKLQADAEKKAETLLATLPEVTANDTEADILEALRLSVRTLAGFGTEYTKVIYVVDTGISTAGLLNFGNNVISADPEAVADALYSMEAIPDFTGITVIWAQMGDVTAPQPELSPAQLNNLKRIWEAIINKTGGTLEFSENLASPVDGTVTYPEVSVVDFPAEIPVAFEEEAGISFDEPQFISEERCGFAGESDEYLDEETAEATLQPIAEYMLSNPDFRVLLVGCTADDIDDYYSRDLSERRAMTVKNTLVQMGVSEDRIDTLGLGSADPWHIYGVGTEGELASQNRKVVILSADSDMAYSLYSY